MHVFNHIKLIWHDVANVACVVVFRIQNHGCHRPTFILTIFLQRKHRKGETKLCFHIHVYTSQNSFNMMLYSHVA